MRKLGTLVVMSLMALAATVRAQDAAPPAVAAPEPAVNVNVAPAPAAGSPRRLQLAAAFLPMGLGKFTYSETFDTTSTHDAHLAYGVGLSANYELLRDVYVGFAPQAIFNVQAKPGSDVFYTPAMKEFDFILRVAYAHRVADTISLFAELLPGYSLIVPSDDSAISKGIVLGAGVGCAVDMSDRYFVTVGGGYQIGFQSQSEGIHKLELRTRYVRVAMGGGIRF